MKNKIQISILLKQIYFSLIFLFSIPIYAQFSSFVTYNLDDGLPSNTAYYVFKDVDGYLWIATDKGLAKYDGYSFTTFTTQDGLSDNEIFEIFQDSKKRIWLSAYNGIPTVYSHGKFFSFENILKQQKILPNGPGYRVLESPGALWILNRKILYKIVNNKVYMFSPGQKQFVTMSYYPKEDKMYILHAYSNISISIDKENKIDTIQFNTPISSGISKSIINGNSIYYTSWKSLCVWDFKNNAGSSFDFGSEVLSVFSSGNDSTIVVGGTNNVFEFNINTKQWKKKFIDQPGVSSIFIDADKSYWTTSLNNGVNFFGNEKVEALTNKNVLPFEYVSLVRKVGNKLLLSSDKFRFCIYNLTTNQVEASFDESGKMPGRGFANIIRVANNGDIYISFRIILLKIDQQGNLTKVPLDQVTYDFLFTPDYYLAVHSEALTRRKSTPSFTQISNDFESMAVNSRHLFLDQASGNVFAYGTAGLFKINLDSFNRVKSFADISEVSRDISSVVKFNDSLFIVGTTVNGMHFLKNDKVVASFSTDEGLSSNYIHCIVVDGNEIWVGTDKGITLLELNLKTGKTYLKYLGKKDGIFSNEINDIFIENDTVYVATPSGLFFFHKDDINHAVEKPVLNIEFIKFNMKEFNLLDQSKLRSPKKNVKIKFTGISYGSLGNITYRYKLDPVDEHWHYTNSREIEYPSLTPNIYSLSIQCKGSRGGWSDTRILQFEIVPALWQRIEIQILFLLFIIIVLIIVIRIRIKSLRKGHEIKQKLLMLENEKLENIKNQAIKDKEMIELEQQALRLHMNPHFIFNAINAIQGFYAGNEINKAKQFISYFSKLLRLILETSKEKLIPVSTEVEILKSYLELFLLRFEDKYTYEIIVNPQIDMETDLIPPMVVQPFVENAVLHGLSPLKKIGNISIVFELEDEILKVSIKDNGIGRKKSSEIKMSSKTKSTGIKVTQMRLKNIDSKLIIHQNVEIIDLEENGISTGTLVILRMPLSS